MNVEGGSSSTQPYAYPFSNFSKYPLHYLLAQASQCLVCPLSICDNASVGSCSGGPASLCFLGSPVVLELSEGRKYVLMSQVLSNTSVKVFFGTKISLRPPNLFFFWGGGGLCTPCPSYSAAYDILTVLETTEDHKDQVKTRVPLSFMQYVTTEEQKIP